MGDLAEIKTGITEVADEYKKMSKVLLIFCALVTVGILVVSVSLYRQSSKS